MEQDYKKENRNSFWYIFGYVGRISRSSFNKALAFYILCIIVLVGLKYISLQNPASDTSIAIGYFLSIPRVFLLWFFIAQGAKRCHDIGKSGWWILLPFYFIWLCFAKGDECENEYGEVPQ